MSNFPTTQHYRPRYTVVIAELGQEPVTALQTDNRDIALETVSELRKEGKPAVFGDNALVYRAGSSDGFVDRGYYGFPFKGRDFIDLENWMEGKINRSADDALDRLDDLCVQKELEHESRIKARNSSILWTPTEPIVID
ncbi:hypothetical protein SEA_CECE_248 [Microbacterium phage Cece]|nr:hypothetical protein SEA_CECE_248 [Microbacterium phage Cece]